MTLRGGGEMILVNEQPTHYDGKCAFRFRDIAAFCEGMSEYFSRSGEAG